MEWAKRLEIKSAEVIQKIDYIYEELKETVDESVFNVSKQDMSGVLKFNLDYLFDDKKKQALKSENYLLNENERITDSNLFVDIMDPENEKFAESFMILEVLDSR